MVTRGPWPVSPVAMGLAFVIPFDICLTIFCGAALFAVAGRMFRRPEQVLHRALVQEREPVCAGIIAGASLCGVAIMACEVFAR